VCKNLVTHTRVPNQLFLTVPTVPTLPYHPYQPYRQMTSVVEVLS